MLPPSAAVVFASTEAVSRALGGLTADLLLFGAVLWACLKFRFLRYLGVLLLGLIALSILCIVVLTPSGIGSGGFGPTNHVPTPAAAPGGVVRPSETTGEQPASVTALVPADAELWLDDYQGKQTGPSRTFKTPPLEPGKDYLYTIRARWHYDGRVIDRTRPVILRAGGAVEVDFIR